MTEPKGNPSRAVTSSQTSADRLSRVSLDSLIAVYYSDPKELGAFQSVSATATPAGYNHLLNHNHHMTVTVEILRDPAQGFAEILEEKKPLGRVLIEHQVLREIELFDLVRVTCGSALARLFSVAEGTTTFGRTAMIYCDREPAIELLEIVAPIDSI